MQMSCQVRQTQAVTVFWLNTQERDDDKESEQAGEFGMLPS